MKNCLKKALKNAIFVPLVLAGLSCGEAPLRSSLETSSQDIEQEFIGKLNPRQRLEAENKTKSWRRDYAEKPTLHEIIESDNIEQLSVEGFSLFGDGPVGKKGLVAQGFKVNFYADLYGISVFLRNDGTENQGVRAARFDDELTCELMWTTKPRGLGTYYIGVSKIKAFSNGTRWVTFPFSKTLEKGDYAFSVILYGDCQMACAFSSDKKSYPDGDRYACYSGDYWTMPPGDLAFKISLLERNPDFDRDKDIDFQDFLLFAKHYGSSSNGTEWNPRYDLDMNDKVDFNDFTKFAEYYNQRNSS